ncbi:MAG: ABC transporter ATP-binding protein [Pseudomonadota bacterium]
MKQAEVNGQVAPILEIEGLTHLYGNFKALDDISVQTMRGEFLTILGESGSGKTTLLKIISGLELPSQVSRLTIAGEDVSSTSASERNCTTVFQNYALFPHMSVGENVEYGLRVRGVKKEERQRRVSEALDQVHLSGTEDRPIYQLSGGQKQRIALARAIVTQPAILLLDEPIGALDEKLREEMQLELVQLQKQLGITFIYITHSQEESLTMSDRVILMRHGRIIQEGGPRELFEYPVNRFVAEFMGFENILEGEVVSQDNNIVTGRVVNRTVCGSWCGVNAPKVGDKICFGIRAERLRLEDDEVQRETEERVNSLEARPGHQIYRGKFLEQNIETQAGVLRATVWDQEKDPSRVASVSWSVEDAVAFPPD